jgi:hypothetical protein
MHRLSVCYNYATHFSPNHTWINFETGYCGITPHIFEEIYSTHSQFVPLNCHRYSIKFYQHIGFLSIDLNEKYLNIVLPSDVSGIIAEINLNWDCNSFEHEKITWTHRMECINEVSPILMDYEDYLAYLQSLH